MHTLLFVALCKHVLVTFMLFSTLARFKIAFLSSQENEITNRILTTLRDLQSEVRIAVRLVDRRFSSPDRPDRPWGPTSLFPGVNRLGLKADHSIRAKIMAGATALLPLWTGTSLHFSDIWAQ